ncbi:hypothetical protein HW561_13500 [Rhodobacteraceae bacterium B1Z28]|uniref:DUF4760 domain-containing protein n=1 Tax=Ruegeria haliotis TaxID=2747601 RepID=A0ABX2PRK6_9RHOB|nr:hypothetical protein [Ruegeria haliotis]NVO56803.1 hypothetical protein [Ruegeria haliotis]
MVIEFLQDVVGVLGVLNEWLSANKLLVFSLAIPAFSYLFSKQYEERSAIRAFDQRQHERNLQKELRLFDLKEKRMEELRRDLARVIELDALAAATSTSEEDKISALETIASLRLRVPIDDPDYQCFHDSCKLSTQRILGEAVDKPILESREKSIRPLVSVGHEILCRWERDLEKNLRMSDMQKGNST